MEWKNSSPSWIFEGVEVEGLVKSIARRTTTTTTKMKMRMAPTSTNRLSAALLLVVTIVGCLLLTQCDAQTTRQDRINDLCDSYRDFPLPPKLKRDLFAFGYQIVEIYPVKVRVAESIARFCKNNDAGN